MSKLVSLSDNMIQTLNMIRDEQECSYTEAIESILRRKNRPFHAKLYEVYLPFQNCIILGIGTKMQHAAEIFRIICILLEKSTNNRDEQIDKLIDILNTYKEELKENDC